MSEIISYLLIAFAVFLGVLALLALVYAIRGHRFTDRIVAVNMVSSITIAMLCILSNYLSESFIVDIVLVYSLLSFIAVVVLSKLVIIRRKGQIEKEELEAAAEKPERIKRRRRRHG